MRLPQVCADCEVSLTRATRRYVPELDRIVLKDSMSQRPFASSSTCRKAVITARILGLVHELCLKGIHVTKRDLFYTDVKLFEVWSSQVQFPFTCARTHAHDLPARTQALLLASTTASITSGANGSCCDTHLMQHCACCRTKATRTARWTMSPAC